MTTNMKIFLIVVIAIFVFPIILNQYYDVANRYQMYNDPELNQPISQFEHGKEDFMRGCDKGGSKEYCECVWNEVKDKITQKDALNLYLYNKVPAPIMDAVRVCN